MQLFSAGVQCERCGVFKRKLNFFLTPNKWKNWPQKLLIIVPDPFISHSSPDHSPQSRIEFSYYEISGPNIWLPPRALKASDAGWSESSSGYFSTTKKLSMQTKPTNKTDSLLLWSNGIIASLKSLFKLKINHLCCLLRMSSKGMNENPIQNWEFCVYSGF